MTNTIINPLSLIDLSFPAALIIILAALSFFGKWRLEWVWLWSALRAIVQLLLVGFILEFVFQSRNIIFIMGIALVMVLIASFEIKRRQTRKFHGITAWLLASLPMMISAFTLNFFALQFVTNHQVWYTPQYAIPLLGMLLGNTMNAVSIGLDRLTDTIYNERDRIEARLMLGDSATQALQPYFITALRAALIPTINALAIAGVVSLPGMMTGQILAGVSPVEAVKYQIFILLLISVSAGFASMFALWLAGKRLFDDRQRLRLERVG